VTVRLLGGERERARVVSAEPGAAQQQPDDGDGERGRLAEGDESGHVGEHAEHRQARLSEPWGEEAHRPALHQQRRQGDAEQQKSDGARPEAVLVQRPDREDRFEDRLRVGHAEGRGGEQGERRALTQQPP
jgi:hypothetical protein